MVQRRPVLHVGGRLRPGHADTGVPHPGAGEGHSLEGATGAGPAGPAVLLENVAVNAANHRVLPVRVRRPAPAGAGGRDPLGRGGQLAKAKWICTTPWSPRMCSTCWRTSRGGPGCGVLVERDADFPDDFADLIDDVRRVRVVLSGAHDGASDDAQLLLAALIVTPDRIGELCADPDGFADRYGYPRWAARSVAKAWSEGLRATATVARAKWTRRVRAVTPETLALLARLTRAPAFPWTSSSPATLRTRHGAGRGRRLPAGGVPGQPHRVGPVGG